MIGRSLGQLHVCFDAAPIDELNFVYNEGMRMFPIIIIALSSMILAFSFAGTAAAQNVAQSDLCALEARSTSAEMNAIAQVQAEENPLKRTELGQAAIKTANEAYRARLDFFDAKYDTGSMEGSRPFTAFTGKVTRFLTDSPGSFSLSVDLGCPQSQSRSVVLAAQFGDPATTPWISSVVALREALLQIKVGSVVEFSGTIFVMVYPRSPTLGRYATVYWTRVVALKDGLSGVTQGTATRSQ
jgi:hypothetical protein